MIGTRRLQRLMLLVGAVTVLLAAGAGSGHAGHAGNTGRLWESAGPAVTAAGTIGSGATGTLDPRLQRDTGAGNGHHCSHNDGLSGPPVLGQQRGASLGALAAVLERAGHPERVGRILLRGPPGSSV